jgi:hypothetical protein
VGFARRIDLDWLQTWDPATVEANRGTTKLMHTASDQFPDRGIAEGDVVFVAYVGDGQRSPRGRLYLIGSLRAASPRSLGIGQSSRGWLTDAETVKLLGTRDIWSADGHVVCEASAASKAVFDREVPADLLPDLTFLVKDGDGWGYSYLKLERDGTLAQQTLRRVRRLDPPSARVLAHIAGRA